MTNINRMKKNNMNACFELDCIMVELCITSQCALSLIYGRAHGGP